MVFLKTVGEVGKTRVEFGIGFWGILISINIFKLIFKCSCIHRYATLDLTTTRTQAFLICVHVDWLDSALHVFCYNYECNSHRQP